MIISPIGEFVKWRKCFFVMPKKPELSATDQALRESIGSSIRLVSAAKGSKPADVAKAGGVSLAHQYRIESGERTADVLYMVKVARHLGISIDELVNANARLPSQAATQTASAGGVNVGGSNSGVVQSNSQPGTVQVAGNGNVIVRRR